MKIDAQYKGARQKKMHFGGAKALHHELLADARFHAVFLLVYIIYIYIYLKQENTEMVN